MTKFWSDIYLRKRQTRKKKEKIEKIVFYDKKIMVINKKNKSYLSLI